MNFGVMCKVFKRSGSSPLTIGHRLLTIVRQLVFARARSGNIWLVVWLFIVLSGCSNAREYVSCDRGFVNLRSKNEWGEGNSIKEYHITAGGTIVNLGESKQGVGALIGSPDEVSLSWGGEEIWKYKDIDIRIHINADGYVSAIRGF